MKTTTTCPLVHHAKAIMSLAMVVLLAGLSGWAGQTGALVFTDDFNAADQALTSYDANYTLWTDTTAELVNSKLRITSAPEWARMGVNGYEGLGDILGGGSHGAGSFIAVDVTAPTAPTGGNHVFAHIDSGNPTAYVVSGGNTSGYWNGSGWTYGGSGQVPRGTETHYAVVIAGDATEHLFVNKQYNTTFPLGASGTDSLRLAIQGTDGVFNVDFDNLVVGRNAENTTGSADTIKSGLELTYSDNFDRANSGTIGTAWTENEQSGIWTIGITDNVVEVESVQAPNWNAGLATLDLTDPTILGRGLQVGEYVEIKVRVDTTHGGANMGAVLLGNPAIYSDPRTAAKLSTWINPFGDDTPAGWKDMGTSTFDASTFVTFGQRLDYADGNFAIVSYYINGDYETSWLYDTTATTLDTFTITANTDQLNNTFVFDDLAIYTIIIPEPASFALLTLAGLALLHRRGRR
jgi:hypothetical protein